MQPQQQNSDTIIRQNRAAYASIYDALRWITPGEADNARKEREGLLSFLSPRVVLGYNDTKLDCRNLSPGCRLCGDGQWSCLFINNVCNARCFYCPAEQKTTDIPTTNTVSFSDPDDYVKYLETFQFRGVSISGGEPLLTHKLTLRYISKVKEHFGDRMYLWLYTNGILATREKLKQLSGLGVDEIRFNIGATEYDLEKVRLAVGIIPRVTVEIPAVPECLDLLKHKVKEMADLGVNFLNLHQIRCTLYNYRQLAERNYSFLHGGHIGVLQSELTALQILRYVVETGINLPVNYCSLVYRNRFQALAARRRYAPHVIKPHEDITAAGMIRSLALEGDLSSLETMAARLDSQQIPGASWYLDRANRKLFLSGRLLPLISPGGFLLKVSYFAASLHPTVTYRNPFCEIRLTEGKSVVVERRTVVRDLSLEGSHISFFIRRFLDDGAGPVSENNESSIPGSDATSRETWHQIEQAESITSGLAAYF